jgi:hypothetical protein
VSCLLLLSTALHRLPPTADLHTAGAAGRSNFNLPGQADVTNCVFVFGCLRSPLAQRDGAMLKVAIQCSQLVALRHLFVWCQEP